MRAFSASCFSLFVAGADLLFAGVLGDAQIVEGVVGFGVDVLHVEHQVVAHVVHAHLLAAGEDLVAAVLLVPLGERGRHVHLLDDVAPADAGVVGAEADLAFLRGVGDDALLGAAEVVVEQILEPHAGDEEEVPAVLAALLDVFHGAVALDAAVVLAGGVEGLVHLLEHVGDLEVGGRLEGIVVAQQSARPKPMTESHLPRAASLTLARSLATWSMLRKAVTGAASLVSLSIIMAMPMPQLGWQPQESWPHSALGP